MSDSPILTLLDQVTDTNSRVWPSGDGWLIAEISGTVEIVLQVEGPTGAWINTDVVMKESGIKHFSLPPRVVVRLHVDGVGQNDNWIAELISDERKTRLS